MTNTIEELLNGAREIGAHLQEEQAKTLLQYLDLLEETNKTLNLTRIPREEYIRLHLLDSLACIPAIELYSAAPISRVLDIGTGAGFPGIPLAVSLPQAHITLLDSTQKKLRFIDSAAATCGIKNCSTIHGRAEVLGRDTTYRGQFDVVVSRAVASFQEVIALMLPFVTTGGIALVMKGPGFLDEMEGAEGLVQHLRGRVLGITELTLPGSSVERAIVVIKKEPFDRERTGNRAKSKNPKQRQRPVRPQRS